MNALWQDIRFTFRTFRKQPGLTAVVLLTIAIGIGANTAIFSAVHGVVLSPLPYPQPERIVKVWPARDRSLSKEILVKLQEGSSSYEWLAAMSADSVKMKSEDRAEIIEGPRVTADFFQVLGAQPQLGRLFQAGDDRPGTRSLVLSHPYWQKRFAGDPTILGETLELSGESYVIVGVTAPDLEPDLEPLSRSFDVALPHLIEPADEDFNANYLNIVGKLKAEVTVHQANAELQALTLAWAEEEGITPEWAETASVVSLHESTVGNIRPTLLLLLGAVSFILLIVIANVANLLLARILSREREISVRNALGAGRWRLAAQMLTETTLLALAGGILGIGLARFCLRALVAFLPADLPRLDAIHLAPQVLLFTLLLTLGTGIVIGLVPAFTAARSERNGSLVAGSMSSSSTKGRRRVRSALVVAEVMLAMTLLASAGVLVKSFLKTLDVDPGFEPAGLAHFQVSPGSPSWESPETLDDYYRRLQGHLANVPGVNEVSVVHAVPVLDGGWVMGTYPYDEPPAEGELPPFVRWRPISPEYFSTAKIRLLAGRTFSDRDLLDTEPIAILNRSTAKAFFGTPEQAIDQAIRIGFEGSQSLRVVGVTEDVHILGLREASPMAAYRPYSQASAALHRIGVDQRSVLVRSNLTKSALTTSMREAVRSHDPFANALNIEPMTEILAASLAQPRALMLLLAAFAGMALLLGAIGLYGVMGYAVRERTKEMGIRLALGAPRASILGNVLLNGLGLATLGLLLGGGLSLVIGRVLANQLFEVSATDLPSLLLAALVLLAAATLATLLPAQRAGRTNPVEALRGD